VQQERGMGISLNEIIYYTGLSLSIAFLTASVALFFIKKIPSVIGYLLKIGRIKTGNKTPGKEIPVGIEVINARIKDQIEGQTILLYEGENISEDVYADIDEGAAEEKTDMLGTVHNYATAVLDADITEILPALDQ